MADLAPKIEEVTGRGMIELRLKPLNAENRKAVATVLGAALPEKPRTSANADKRSILWLSPDHWLITSPAGETAGLVEALSKALAKHEHAVTDVSDARRVLRLSGAGACLTLMKGTSTDLLHGDVKEGFVRRARFADLATLIACTGDDSFEIYVFRSYFDYLKRWLEQTGREASLFDLFGSQPAPAV